MYDSKSKEIHFTQIEDVGKISGSNVALKITFAYFFIINEKIKKLKDTFCILGQFVFKRVATRVRCCLKYLRKINLDLHVFLNF